MIKAYWFLVATVVLLVVWSASVAVDISTNIAAVKEAFGLQDEVPLRRQRDLKVEADEGIFNILPVTPVKSPWQLTHTPNQDGSFRYKSTEPRAAICSSNPVAVIGVHLFTLEQITGYAEAEGVQVADIVEVHKNALFSLSLLAPAIKTVAFTSKIGDWKDFTDSLHIEINDQFELAPNGLPYLRSLMVALEDMAYSTFYGVTDANLIFSPDFVKVLQATQEKMCSSDMTTKVLVTARNHLVSQVSQVVPFSPAKVLENLERWKTESKMGAKDDIGFTVSTRGLFRWADLESFPDIVVGKVKAHTSVVLLAFQSGAAVVDATQVAKPVQVSEFSSLFGGGIKGDKKSDYWNTRTWYPMVISEQIKGKSGHVHLAHYYTLQKYKTVFLNTTTQFPPLDLSQ